MSTELLQELGLSLNEARIYETLLDQKKATVGEISSKSKIHRRSIYDTINRLVDKGLVFPILSSRESQYCPVDPDKFLEILKEKELKFKKILPDLKERFVRKETEHEAYIYTGIEGIKNYMRDFLRLGEDLYTIGGNLCWQDPKIKTFTEQVLKEAKRKKINFHLIYQDIVKENGLKESFGDNDNYRFLPKNYDTNSGIDIFGNYIVSFSGIG
jgi:sugar-specific transcriptional regulator TrmB